jgi:ABC-2 type transport system permease protein
MVFIMGFSFGLIVWLPIAFSGHGGSSMMAEHYLTIVNVYALILLGEVSYLNSFGFDRSSVQVYFSVPVRIARFFAGKNIAVVLFILIEMLAVTLAAFVLRIRLAPATVLETFVVTPIVAVYLLAIGNLSSVHFPRAMNPERISQSGVASRLQALTFVFYPVALVPVLLAFWARHIFGSELVFSVILAFATLLGVVVYRIAMDSAVRTVVQGRENILIELARSEGPLANE